MNTETDFADLGRLNRFDLLAGNPIRTAISHQPTDHIGRVHRHCFTSENPREAEQICQSQEHQKVLTWFRGGSGFLQKSWSSREGKIELDESRVKSPFLFSPKHQSLSASFDLTREKFDFQKNWLPDMDSNHD